jgi:hypothetical protein
VIPVSDSAPGSIDWPAGLDRTAPGDRGRGRNFKVSLASAVAELEDELDRLDPDDWRVSFGNTHSKSNGMPLHNANPDDPGFALYWTADGDDYAVACDASPSLRDNLRQVHKWLHETRLRSDRPVRTADTEFAAARLPSADDVIAGSAPPHEVLDVSPDASEAVVKGAARAMKKDVHPDNGGSREEFQRIVDAENALLDGGDR